MNKTDAAVDTVAARELDLYAENTAELYPQFQSIIANMKRRIKNDTYDPALAPKRWLYWYSEAARRYVREFASINDLGITFPLAVRQYCAAERAIQEAEKIANGEYDS